MEDYRSPYSRRDQRRTLTTMDYAISEARSFIRIYSDDLDEDERTYVKAVRGARIEGKGGT